jgi:hypothetical protein
LDECIFVHGTRSLTFVDIYVDDIMVIAPSLDDVNAVKNHLNTKYDMKDCGKIDKFLNIKFVHFDDGIMINQKERIEQLAKSYDCEKVSPNLLLPMPAKLLFDKEFKSKLLDDPTEYRTIVGKLIYIARVYRPDIYFSTIQLSRYHTSHPFCVYLFETYI